VGLHGSKGKKKSSKGLPGGVGWGVEGLAAFTTQENGTGGETTRKKGKNVKITIQAIANTSRGIFLLNSGETVLKRVGGGKASLKGWTDQKRGRTRPGP